MRKIFFIIFFLIWLLTQGYSKSLCLYFYGSVFSLSSFNAYINFFEKKFEIRGFDEIYIIFLENIYKEVYYYEYADTVKQLNEVFKSCSKNIVFDEEIINLYHNVVSKNKYCLVVKQNLCSCLQKFFKQIKYSKIYVFYDTNTMISEINKSQFQECMKDWDVEYISFDTTVKLDNYLLSHKFSTSDVIVNLIYSLNQDYKRVDEVYVMRVLAYKFKENLLISNRYMMIRYGADIVYDIDYRKIFEELKQYIYSSKCEVLNKKYEIFFNTHSNKPLMKFILQNYKKINKVF